MKKFFEVKFTFNPKAEGLVLKGTNLKRDGKFRKWCDVVTTGNISKSTVDGSLMMEVWEGTNRRIVNMRTFIGIAGNVVYEKGRKVDTLPTESIVNQSTYHIA